MRASGAACVLHHTHLTEFIEFLWLNGITWRSTEAQYQVMQVQYKGNWLPVYDRLAAKEHYSVDSRLMPVVRKFLRERKEK